MTDRSVTESRLKKKLIKRILAYSELYTKDYLAELPFDTLLDIQNKCLIKLKLRTAFKNRHKSKKPKF